ncbi:hypothetical protein BCR42DRAFT_491956 [Absidia repens]|uniref:Ubiquitin-like domain-containing protein n=1 Tax=Absidia repens TaxID=90262 RepID=A0A1X2IHZ0_9FUNG|nr:hypothetical protein BCR42DRAFT_491956 [Absidia repens]
MSSDTWTLLIKTMSQTMRSVVVPSSASVLQLKDAIRLEFDIANDRQRLIFQGKVLKDGTQLTDYSNLEDGKIIHLVARPADAPTNPVNDEPLSTPRGSTPQMFPGMAEGYTFITLDANISDLGGSTSALSSLFSGILGGASDRNGAMNGPMNTRTQYTFSLPSQNNTAARNNNGTTPRPSLTLGDWLNRRQPGEFSSLLDNTVPRATTQPSLETRLIRTVSAMTNIRTNLDALPGEADTTQFNPAAASNASPETIQTIRSQLRASGTSEMAQVGYVVNNISDLMDTMSARMRQLGQELQTENASHDQLAPRLQHMVSSIQNLNTVNQFVGDIMGSVTSPRQRRSLRSSTRGRNQQVNTAGTTSRNTRRTQSRNPPSSTMTTRSPETVTSSPSSSSSSASSSGKRKSRSSKALDTATTSSSKKRKTRSTSAATTDHSSSSTTASSSSKRQKSNKTNLKTGNRHTTSTATTKKGKGIRRSVDGDN